MRARTLRVLLFTGCAAAASLAAGCDEESDSTQLIVLVHSDYEPELELSHVTVSVLRAERTTTRRFRIVRSSSEAREASASDSDDVVTELPFSFGVRPPDGDADARVEMTLSALGPDGELRVRRRVRVGFVGGERRLLRVELSRACEDVYEGCESPASGPSETCDDGRCVSIDVDVRSLPRVGPGDELADSGLLLPGCEGACVDAGPDAGGPSDGGGDAEPQGPGPEGGTAGTAGGGGAGRGGPDDGGDAEDAGDAGAGDGGDVVPLDCGQQSGFFADVGRDLTANAEGQVCVTVAQSGYDDEVETREEKLANALMEVGWALDAELDIVELRVVQQGSTLYASGFKTSTTDLPSLSDVLAAPALVGADQSIKLYVTDELLSSSSFAEAVLDLLVSDEGAPYASDCRPIYLVAQGAIGLDALLATRSLLETDDDYAELRGLLHFGSHVAPNLSPELAREAISELASQDLEIVELDFAREAVLGLAYHARELDLQVFVRETPQRGLHVALCGLVDAVETPDLYPEFQEAIRSSRRLIDLDLTDTATTATELAYFARPPGSEVVRALGSGTPTLASGGTSSPLVGSFLRFDADAQQSLVLHDANPPSGTWRFAALAYLRLSTTVLPMSGRQVIASKQSSMAGWWLELANDDGTTELRWQAFIDDVGSPVLLSASTPASTFDTTSPQLLIFGWHGEVELNYASDYVKSAYFDSNAAVVNAESVTLGGAAGGGDHFEGDLQHFRMFAY